MINIIVGGLGGGKTVLAVYLALNKSKQKRTIISNAHLQIPHIYKSTEELTEYILSNMEAMSYENSIFSNAVLIWDEAHYTFEARQSSSLLSLELTRFITQLGKLDCYAIFTSQIAESQLDLRLRQLANAWYYVYRSDRKGNPVDGDRIVEEKVWIRGYYQKMIIPGVVGSLKSFIFDPSPIYALYNTREFMYMDRQKLTAQLKQKQKS